MVIDIEQTGNTETFMRHLEHLKDTYSHKGKIILVLDNVKFHHSKLIQAWFEANSKFEIEFLPPYSPNLNPIERVWWYMRKSITHNRYVESMECRIQKFKILFHDFLLPNITVKNICVTNF